jgi:transcriptional regulator with XRE-family HTH domain
MISTTKNVGKLIFEHRKILKLSQKKVSIQLGLKNGQYLYNIEKGRCGFPPKKLAKLSLILHIPLEKLKAAMVQDYIENINNEIEKSLV